MKLEGMDAAARTATAQGYASEPVRPDYHHCAPQEHASSPPPRAGHAASPAQAADRQQSDKKNRQNGSEERISEKVINEALEKANRILLGSDRRFEVTFHEKTKEVMVRVVDSQTNKTIREIPPKKIVDIVVRLCEMAGIIFDKKG
jgi:uncharacterized FlaG/YvyC family protein